MKKTPDIEVAKKMINLQQSATSRGFEFDLSFETVKSLMTRTHCYYTGVIFEEDGKLAFSVDRLDSKKGYIEGNVVACTIDINAKKANLTFEEIEQLYNKLIKLAKTNPTKPIHRKTKNTNNISPLENSSDKLETIDNLHTKL